MAKPIANAGGDRVIDLSGSGTIGSGVSKVFNANSSAPGTGALAISSWQWYVLDQPSTSSAVLTNSTTSIVTISPIDTWGTYRLFLVVTDDQGNASETDPVKAPNAAFAHVYVKSTTLGLIQPAVGQRDWATYTNEAIADLEQFRIDFNARTVAGISDTTATGAELNTLTGAGSATGLHTHSGSDFAAGTTSALGVVKLAEAPLDGANPKAVTQARGIFSASVSHTFGQSGMAPMVSGPTTTSPAPWVAAWLAPEAITLSEWGFTLLNGGTTSGGGYKLSLYKLTQAAFIATTGNTLSGTGISLIQQSTLALPATDFKPVLYATAAGALSTAIAVGEVVCVAVTDYPAIIHDMGQGLTVTVGWRVKF